MPRRSSGPRLWFDKKRGTWSIVFGRIRSRTGFTELETRQAQKALGEYIAGQHVVKDSAEPFLADVLAAYAEEHLSNKISEHAILYDIKNLGSYWGKMRVSEVTAKQCRAYVAHREAPVSARRELAFLNAAIKHWHREHGPLKIVPVVTLPPAPKSRDHWLTRSEAARFLWAARRTPHVARLFIIGWYTGSRLAVILGLKWSMIHFETKIMQRKEKGWVETKKKSPDVRMGDRLMSHLRRWKKLDGKKMVYICHYQGKKISRPATSWDRIRTAAGLPDYVTPHILRHSRATHLMQQGVNQWAAASSLGMSTTMLEKVYGHHHPDWQKDAADAR